MGCKFAFQTLVAVLLLLVSASHAVRVISPEELQEKGDGDTLWLSILGEVYDVSAGKQFYGEDGPYRIFAGRDGSVCFLTGIFTEEEAAKPLSVLTPSQLYGLEDWRKSYVENEKYLFVGVLEGSLYDGEGNPTEELKALQVVIAEEKVKVDQKEKERQDRIKNRKAKEL